MSFAASVGMLLAAYVLREWQRDRSALIYLVGALPLPITIIAPLHLAGRAQPACSTGASSFGRALLRAAA